MKKNTILLSALFLGLLTGTAGNAQDTSKCKKLHIENVALFQIRVTYKDCLTGKLVDRQKVTTREANFLLDPSINSDKELRIEGVWLAQEFLWKADTAGSGWNVICEESIAHPVCIGRPMGTPNCKHLSVKNDGVYTAQVEFKECKTKNPVESRLNQGEKENYYVEPNTNIRIVMLAGGTIWPKTQNDIPIGNGYDILCKGLVPTSAAWCEANPYSK